MIKRIALIGSDGQLGTDIRHVLSGAAFDVIPLTHKDGDIRDLEKMEAVLTKIDPQLVINTAAKHHVERCETEAVEAFQVNGIGVLNLSKIAAKLAVPLMHISSDYIFDGRKGIPYTESDLPSPLNVYATSKIAGEYFVSAYAKRFYILRVSGIYGTAQCIDKGYNFPEMMMNLAKDRDKLRVVDDEILSPTYTGDIASQICHMIRNDAPFGIYHVTSEGSCSWYEFTKELFRLTETPVVIEKAAPGEFASKVNRPKYSVLENIRLNSLNLNIMDDWQAGLKRYVDALNEGN